MNPKKNFLLLLILLLAGGAYYLYDVKWAAEKKTEEERKLKVLKGIDAKNLIRISIERKDEPYQMIRTDKGWRFVKPVDAAVDEDAIERLLKAAERMKEERRVGPAAEAGEFGLSTPYMKLTFGIKGQDDVALSLGDLNPTREFRYASVKDGGVFTLPINDYSPFNMPVFQLRERAIVTVDPDKVQKVAVEPKGGGAFTVVRLGKEQWELTAPVKDQADRTEADGIASTLKYEKIQRFVEEEPKDLQRYGLDAPRLTVQLFTDAQGMPTDGVMLGNPIEQEEEEKGEKVKKTYYHGRRLSGGPVFLVSEKAYGDLPQWDFMLEADG
ncbi:MAG: DUF4340 domain-containing protein, partial [Nitrospinota bacterium]